MKNTMNHLARTNVKNLIPYQSARRIGGTHGDIFLNANESPISSMFTLKTGIFNRYPECQPNCLISSYAKYVNLLNNQILVTRGADEGIELLIKAFCEPGKDSIIYCPPTYDMYRLNAQISGIEVKAIPIIKDTWKLNLSDIKENLDTVKLIYICNPNNPTGNVFLKNDLLYLLKITQNKALVVIDEAYIEFTKKNSIVNEIKNYSNLVILRTLSKAFGLAGIRCGFTLANKEIIDTLNKVISPYPISIPVIDIANQALQKKYINTMENHVSILNENRIWLIQKLKNCSLVEQVFDSHANYVLVRFFISEEIFKNLWNQGIIVRNQNEKIHLTKCLRITVGTRIECMRVIQVLECFSKNNILFSKRC